MRPDELAAAAIAALHLELAERPRNPDAQLRLGLLLLQTGRPASAVQSLRAALDLQPGNMQAAMALTGAMIDIGQGDAAVEIARQQVAALPRDASPLLIQASILYRLGRLEQACDSCQLAVALAPHSPQALNSLGATLIECDRIEEAETVLRRAVAVAPDFAPAQRNLGGTLKQLGRAEEAEICFRAVLARDGDFRTQAELGAVLLHQGRFDEARACFGSAIAGDPNCVEAHMGLAHLTLLLGDYATGLPLLEWRNRMRPEASQFGQVLWRGEDISQQTILLHAEQGFGDTIQFVRYLPEMARRARRIVLVVQGELRRLLEPGYQAYLAQSRDDIAACTVRAPLMSLPHLCGTRADTIPLPPYIRADPAATARWRARLAIPGKRLVGLVWGGNPRNRSDRMRSLEPALLAPFAAIPGIAWINLQLGRDESALSVLPGMIDPTAELGDFVDTAALIGALDLMVSVETAVAHLTGALARPGWVLLPFLPDWRWHFGTESSPWYPSLRLFRQDASRDWPPVIARVAAELTAWAEAT
jgi:tetratricopeptide (TPR) repeat protein